MREYEHAGDVLRIEMVRCGFTLETLSLRTGVSQPVLRNILTGRAKSISTRIICALAGPLGYSASELIDLFSGVLV